MDLPDKKINPVANLDNFALIDEISGLNNFLDNYMNVTNLPEVVKDRIRSRMFRYESAKPKEVALNEMREVLFGSGRWIYQPIIYLNKFP